MTDSDSDSQLFGFAEDWQHNACLSYSNDQWGLYISGYSRAAELLDEHVKTHASDLDTLLYPIVYLSQHYLELLLKRTLVESQDLLDLPRKLPTTHRLDLLWKDLRPLVLDIYEGSDPEELLKLDVVVQELVTMDKKSTAFRYPEDTRGELSLPNELRHINIRQFTEVLRTGADLLEGISMGIGVYLDSRPDPEHDSYH